MAPLPALPITIKGTVLPGIPDEEEGEGPTGPPELLAPPPKAQSSFSVTGSLATRVEAGAGAGVEGCAGARVVV